MALDFLLIDYCFCGSQLVGKEQSRFVLPKEVEDDRLDDVVLVVLILRYNIFTS